MRMPTLILITVFLVAIICFTQAVSDYDDDDNNCDMSKSHKLELAFKLNMLMRHSGWQSMDNVKIKLNKNKREEIANPMSEILEALSSGREPINESNVAERYLEIWTVLRCKYAEVILKCRILIQHFIRVCRKEKIYDGKKPTDASLQKYYSCFNLLLSKLHGMSVRFKYMTDALDFMFVQGTQSGLKQGVMVGTQKLFNYTSTVGPSTSSKLSEKGINENSVDIEIKNISDYIMRVYSRHIYWYINNRCIAPPKEDWTTLQVIDEFLYKRINQLIPGETTIVQYVIDQLDSYASDIFDSCFYNLGFAYDVTGNVTIRNN